MRIKLQPHHLFVAPIVAVIMFGEESVCRSLACTRESYEIGDNICYETTYYYSVSATYNNRFAAQYFNLRQETFPQLRTVVRKGKKVIGILEPGAATPFIKDIPHEEEQCIVAQ